MRRPATNVWMLAFAALAAGCPEPPGSQDAGADAAFDAGPPPLPDAGPPPDDAGVQRDGGTDSGTVADSGPSQLRVLTWNVHDFFDDVDDPSRQDDVLTASQVTAKVTAVGGVLRRVNADLLVLQEVENIGMLNRLKDGPLAGTGYTNTYLAEAYDPRGIDIGVITKFPLDQYVSHTTDRDPTGAYLWSRDCVEIHFKRAGRHVALLGNHFISQSGGNDTRRTYQAQQARAYADGIAAADTSALVGVLGDLNDTPTATPLQPLLGDKVYLDLGGTLPTATNWTYVSGSSRSRLDYILIHGRSSSWVVRVEVTDGTDVLAASDHRPVVADFLVPPR